jgi:nucleoside 2-deoxyribosyltransferase
MLNFLKNKLCYLSGPIQYAKNDFWRAEPIHVLQNRFSVNVFDPFADEKQKWTDELLKAKNINDTETLTKIAKQFVRKDLGMVDRSDFLIAYLPHGVQTIGTVHEIINSNESKKPTLLVTDADTISSIPLWYFGFIKTKYMFAGWRALYKYLEDVNVGKHIDDDKWHIVCDVI